MKPLHLTLSTEALIERAGRDAYDAEDMVGMLATVETALQIVEDRLGALVDRLDGRHPFIAVRAIAAMNRIDAEDWRILHQAQAEAQAAYAAAEAKEHRWLMAATSF